MSLTSKAIETLAVNAVKNSISTSDYLDQCISDNDKGPSWDGFVYIYSEKSKKKSVFKGRMPVQVKGKEHSDFSKRNISYSMSVVDLRNYLNDGGCILFVVYVNRSELTKIYYAELTPIKLRRLLKGVNPNGNKTIHLKEFPSDSNLKETIFFNCLQNCQKQAGFNEYGLFSLEELEKQGVLENIVIPVSGVGITDPQMALIKNEVYAYAKIKGCPIPQPLDMIFEDIHTLQTIDAQVTIDNVVYYTKYCVEKSLQGVTILLGDSLTIKFNNYDSPLKINYSNSNKFRVLAKDLEFMIAYWEKGYFEIDGIKFPIDYSNVDNSNFNIKKQKEHLEFAKKTVQLLDLLGCKEDIDIRELNDRDWGNLNILLTAFIDKKPVKGLKDGLSFVSCIKVGKLKIAVCLKKCAEKGVYEVYDFFKIEMSVSFTDGNNGNKALPISQFSVLHVEDLLTLNNIDFNILLSSFQKPERHCETFNRANLFLLELLEAYDKAEGDRKEQLLKSCKDFSEWILEATDEELEYEIRILNHLQTIKRYRDLNIDETFKLYEIIKNTDTRADCLVGAYLLLGQQEMAQKYFDLLSGPEQENFKKYPIYTFWKT